MTFTTLHDKDGIMLAVRDPEWPPRTVEEVCASRLPELEEILEELRTTAPRGIRAWELLPGLHVGQNAGAPLTSPTTYRVTAQRDDGTGNFSSSTRGFPGLDEASEDARTALAAYPAYVRSLMSGLLRAGVDLRETADRALAESVMES